GLLAGFALAAAWWTGYERAPVVQWLRPAMTVAVVFICYTTLGSLGMAAVPYRADTSPNHRDGILFGVDPSLFLQRYLTPGRVEFFSFIYACFIPYIYLSIILGCLGRPPLERDQFMTGWVFTYAISYLGYLFVPAQGPVSLHADDYQVPLQGGFF